MNFSLIISIFGFVILFTLQKALILFQNFSKMIKYLMKVPLTYQSILIQLNRF